MPVKVDALIDALRAKMSQAPDVSTEAVRKMSATGQRVIKDTLASGTPLNLRTGHLRDSVMETYFSPGAVAQAHVAPTAIYSRIQELGGVSGEDYHTVLRPRPYVAPTIEASLDMFRQDAIDELRILF